MALTPFHPLQFLVTTAVLLHLCVAEESGTAPSQSAAVNDYNAEYGVFLGDLPNLLDGDVSGRVYVINDTALQIINFTYNGKDPDLYFWLDREENPTVNGTKIPSFEYGITPIGAYTNAARVLLLLPGQRKISSFRSFSLFSFKFKQTFSSLPIPETLTVPRHKFLAAGLKGSRYSVGSGPILVVDRRTIKVYGFTFEGDKAPDGYFFVGRGPNVAYDAGVKVPIKGRDTPELITAMNEHYRGGQDILLTLPDDYDIEHIDWISIYCYKFQVDFGHVTVSDINSRIPPFVPQQKRFDEVKSGTTGAWPTISLLGTDLRKNFTFQLGLPGGKKGYQAKTHSRPAPYVWYVNGYLADIYLRRHVTYTFIVEGGDSNATSDSQFNPLYISDDPYGGYCKLTQDERDQVKIYAGAEPSQTAGRLTVWTGDNAEASADSFSSFVDFRKQLRPKCEENKRPAIFSFTPDDTTPDTLYYNSYSTYNMGYKIHIVHELPPLPDWTEEPFECESWRQQSQMDGALTASAALRSLSALFFSLLVLAPLLV